MRAVGLMLVLLAAPAALGQVGLVTPTLAVFVEDPGRAFVPGTVEPVTVVVNYNPTPTGRPTPAPTAERPENTAPTRITIAPKTLPTWVSEATIEPAEIFVQMGVENTSTSNTRRVVAFLNVSPDAPALQRETFAVTATADPNGNIAGATADSVDDLKLRATTVGRLNVSAEPLLVAPGGRWVVVPFTVRNDGNSEIVAKVNVTVRPENSQIEFHDTLQLARGESKLVEVRMRTPWTAAEFGALELEAVPIVDGEEGEAARAEVDVRGQSAVPTGGALAMLAALVLVAGRRRAP